MSFKNITILYVEDEKEIRENTKRPLEYLCDELLMASNGEEGLEIYKNRDIDIVVSDIKMPKMNGIEMCKAIKSIDKDQHIVFTTAYSDSRYFIEAIEMQVDGYILKPIDYDLLENKIKSIVKQINAKLQLQRQKILISEIIKLHDNLLVVLNKEQEEVFSNENFLNFFQVENLEKFRNKYESIKKIIAENGDNFSNTENNQKIVVKMTNQETKKLQTFLASFRTIKETQHTIIVFTEITNIATEKERYKHKAFTDELTGLYNRAFFNEVVKREIEAYEKNKCLFGLIMFDIDFFKMINDTYGHQVGDEILKELSKIIKRNIRESDIFARWGGEEFVIVLPKTSRDDILKVAQNLKKVVENHSFKNDLKITCSFGVSSFSKYDTFDTIIKRADTALYKAKKEGRNKVEIL